MSDNSLTKFTTKMLSMNVFNCAACRNLLKTPVKQVTELGNVCAECWQKNKWSGTANPELELILNELKFPCKFQASGCKDNVKFKDLESHETNCRYHTKKCLLFNNGCKWLGIQTDFASHFIENHPDHTLNSPTSQFGINIDIECPTDVTKLLKGRKETCIITMRPDRASNTLSYTIYDAKGSNNAHECIIKHKGLTANFIETRCKMSSLLNSDKTSEHNFVVTIDLAVLKQITGVTHSVNLIITTSNPDEMQELDEKMLQYFECPVCKNLMKPPIYQCKFGHSFCNACKPKLEKCPTCRGIFESTRNYSLEGLTSGIQYACVYHHLGCDATLGANDNGKHETLCTFRPYECPLSDCRFTGNYTTIISHLNNFHPDKVVSASCYRTTMEFRLDQLMDFFNFQQKLFMVFDDNIFRLSFKRNSDYSFWAVEVLRKYDEDAVYIYEIGIVDMRKPDRKLIRTDLCFNESNTDDLFKKCILFPNNIISSYASNGMFTYYCQVYKRS